MSKRTSLFSLRSRLLLSHVLVISLCLAISGAIFLYLLRGYREELAKGRLADLAFPVMSQVRAYDRSNVTSSQLASALQIQGQDLHARILVLDRGSVVVADTEGRLTGKVMTLHPTYSTGGRHAMNTGQLLEKGSGSYYYVAVPMPNGEAPFVNERPSAFSEVVVATPSNSIVDAWRELLPSLLVAAISSLALSILVSLWLSRSIAGPVVQMTRATEAMARGQLDQALPVHQNDEIGRLAIAFNVMAAQVNASQRLLRDFVANVSHELRTPLTSVQGFAQAIMDGTAKTPEDVTLAAAIIVEESDRMHRLVDDLLYLSKLESGQLPIERSTVDLGDLIALSIERLSRHAEQACVQVRSDVAPMPPVSVDGSRMEQVLANLLSNALKHTPEGGSVDVGARLEPRKLGPSSQSTSPVAVIEVHNTGSFIEQDDRERIFERFYQVDKSRKREGGGAGLGLAICHEIVAAHGGSIRVQSNPERGTTFQVTIPLIETTTPAERKRRQVGVVTRGARRWGRRRTADPVQAKPTDAAPIPTSVRS